VSTAKIALPDLRSIPRQSNVEGARGLHGAAHLTPDTLTVVRTRPLFLSTCAYLVSQSFMVPIAVIGPSWAVWPTLADLSVALMLAARLMVGRGGAIKSPSAASGLRAFVLVSFFCGFSYLVQTIFLQGGDANAGDKALTLGGFDKALSFGGFALYRLLQFGIVLWSVSALRLTPMRRSALLTLSLITFFLVCLGVILTFFSIIAPGQFAAHLPHNRSAGAWLNYMKSDEGLGTIGYNHTYPAVQIVALLALSLHLAGDARPHLIMTTILLSLGLLACFLTGSRTGLITMLLFCAIAFLQVPARARFGVAALLLLIFPMVALVGPLCEMSEGPGDLNGDIYARQKTIFHALRSENLSGRDEMWAERIAYLNEDPIRWVFGSGWGSSAADLPGEEAHNGALQIVQELGIVGLLAWGVLFFRWFRLLWLLECNSRAIFWLGICLLVSSFSQNTLYPMAWLGHFLGLYVFSLGIALRPKEPLS
jgi:O-Antigen ligase